MANAIFLYLCHSDREVGAIALNRSEPDWRSGRFGEPPLPKPGIVDDRAVAKQNAARFGAGAIRCVEDDEITGKASTVSRGEFGRSWIALPLDA
jgi:hypothetical protein